MKIRMVVVTCVAVFLQEQIEPDLYRNAIVCLHLPLDKVR
jgi:hypothetical protein